MLQEIEGEGYVVRELYVDTFSVNISRAAEEVAAMFKVRIVPVSAGTPQEMAYAERAVQTLAQMSRALMVGAPHLPGFCWGLSYRQLTFTVPYPKRVKKESHLMNAPLGAHLITKIQCL